MALTVKAPRGTADVLPENAHKWRYIEDEARGVAALYGFSEVRFPTFEHTELFERGVGGTTDVVQKEMYTFLDKGGRSVTLRPEGTASTVRLVIEHALYGGPMPLRLYYIGSCFRYEKPQAGRLREFCQFGAEVFGAPLPAADAEVIAMVDMLFSRLGISQHVRLEINSIGCRGCRSQYLALLREYFNERAGGLCRTCLERLERNPLRLLDCKEEGCRTVNAGAPLPAEHLCGECAAHFDGVKERLNALGIAYTVNGRIVRGLDYYTKTVFEFISDAIGAQSAVCAGGRYDGLTEELGGPALTGLGFAMGLERVLLLMEKTGAPFPEPPRCDVYLATVGEAASKRAQAIAGSLRKAGLCAQCDITGRSLKAQMKYADKLGARYTVVLGDDELAAGRASLKRMDTGESVTVSLGSLADEIKRMG